MARVNLQIELLKRTVYCEKENKCRRFFSSMYILRGNAASDHLSSTEISWIFQFDFIMHCVHCATSVKKEEIPLYYASKDRLCISLSAWQQIQWDEANKATTDETACFWEKVCISNRVSTGPGSSKEVRLLPVLPRSEKQQPVPKVHQTDV